MAAWLMNAEGRLNFTEQQSLIQILLSLMRVDLARHLYPREGGVKERVFDRVVDYYEKLVGAEIQVGGIVWGDRVADYYPHFCSNESW